VGIHRTRKLPGHVPWKLGPKPPKASLAPVPAAVWAGASSLLPDLPKLVPEPLLLPSRGVVDVLTDFMCLALQAPALLVALPIRAPTRWATWRRPGRSRPSLYRDNTSRGRVSSVELVRDTERQRSDGDGDELILRRIMASRSSIVLPTRRTLTREQAFHVRISARLRPARVDCTFGSLSLP
jgi:hypothetical protein